jgi:hypothetical protein
VPKVDIDPTISIIKQSIPFAKMLAKISLTQWDDQAVVILEWAVNDASIIAMLRMIFDDPEVVALAGIERTAAIYKAIALHSTDEHAAAAEAAGIPWATLLTYLPQIITLILTLLGKRR